MPPTSRSGARIEKEADRWHVQWAENKVELFAPNWKLVCGSRDSGNGALYEQIAAAMNAALASASEKQAPITDNDKRWRFLEHGCQWVSFTPIGGETRSFDPRIVSGYAGHLGDMRETVDREADKHLAILREGVNATKR